jgi:hypothetical protein
MTTARTTRTPLRAAATVLPVTATTHRDPSAGPDGDPR